MQPRGRKSELKGDTRRRELVDAVKRVLKEGVSFADLSIENITAEAGISRSTFYFYFESKHQALEAALASVQLAMEKQADVFFKGGHSDPFMELQEALEGVVKIWRKEEHIMKALVEAAASDKALWKSLDNFVEFFVQPTSLSIVEIHKNQGRITTQEEAEELARTLMWGNERNFYRASVSKFSKKEWEKLVENVTRVWAGAILGNT